jgi:transcriptional regulator with XRE-family HTH domain
MKHRAFNYVRTHRLRHALSAEDLAGLLNQRSTTSVSMFENGERLPNLEGALALQVVFGMAPREMFPDFFASVEEAVMLRACALYQRLEGFTDRASIARRDLIEDMPRRAGTNDIAL